jgi:replication factor C subunit 2/4
MESSTFVLKFDKIQKKNKIPWIEKYRPKYLRSIVQQEEIVNILQKSIENNTSIPHLLFYGQAGTGKTSTILAYCHELFGPALMHDRVLELNASDESGINIVRNKILTFVKKTLCNPDPAYPSPKFKIVILDEADSMTFEAQTALRKVIEEYSKQNIFCMICNYKNKIIDPLISRCMCFRFKPIKKKNIMTKLEYICKHEKFTINKKILRTVLHISKGDIRKSIMILQNLRYLYDYNKGIINQKDIYDITGYVPKYIIKNVLNICKNPESTFDKIYKCVNYLHTESYPINTILYTINDIYIKCTETSDSMKSSIFYNLAISEKKLNDGSNEYIQLLNIFIYIYNLYKYPDNILLPEIDL